MSLNIANREIQNVHIVDDNESARETYGDLVKILDLNPIPEEGEFKNVTEMYARIDNGHSAAICDYNLNLTGYAEFKGAEMVKFLIQKNIPAILCTKYGVAEIDAIREYREWIPSLINPNDLDELMIEGFEKCIKEFNNEFSEERRTWRTLVRVEYIDIEHNVFYIIIPGWDTNQGVRIRLASVPGEISKKVTEGVERFAVKVNVGATHLNDLFFKEWEY